MTTKTFWQFIAENEGNCSICKNVNITEGEGVLKADYSPAGELRGVLCKNCISLVNTMEYRLDDMVSYLRPGHVTMHNAVAQVQAEEDKPKVTEWVRTELPPVMPKNASKNGRIYAKLSDRQAARDLIITMLEDGPKTRGDIMTALDMDRNESYKILKTMDALGLVKMVGAKRGAKWTLADN